MWSALQATILFILDPALAAGDKPVGDDKCLKPEGDGEAKEVKEEKTLLMSSKEKGGTSVQPSVMSKQQEKEKKMNEKQQQDY